MAQAKKKAKAKAPPDAAEAAIEESLRRAQQIWSSGLGTTLEILKDADAHLSARLHTIAKAHGGPSGTFTEASAIATRKQVGLVTEYLEKRLAGHTHAQARKAIAVGVQQTVTVVRALEHKFTGLTRPLALDTQQMQDATIRGTNASLLQKHTASTQRYGKAMVADFERVIRTAQIEGLSQHETISRLVEAGELGGHNAKSLHGAEPQHFPEPTSYVKRRYWAERIVRTEQAHALAAGSLQAMNVTREKEFPDLQKKILAMMGDPRTAPDSIAVHGQVRKLEEMFQDGAGRQYLHPPGRPNDRETIIPWRPHWENTPSTTPPSATEQATAQVQAAPSPLGADRKEELKGALAKAKAKILAQKAQAKAEQEQAAAFAEAEAKAKAEALAAERKAQAVAKAKAEAEARAAKLKQDAHDAVELYKDPQLYSQSSGKAFLDDLKALAKKDPRLFVETWTQATGEPASKIQATLGKPMQLGKAVKQMAVKLQPTLEYPLPKGKKKLPPPVPVAPEVLLEQKKLALLAPNQTAVQLSTAAEAFTPAELGELLKANPLVLPGELEEVLAMSKTGKAAYLHQVVDDWEDLKKDAAGLTLKTEPHGGKHYVDVYEGQKKVAYYFQEGTAEAPHWVVKPPATLATTHPEMKFTQQVEATAYSIEVGKQLQIVKEIEAGKAAEGKALKATQSKVKGNAPAWDEKWQHPERPVADLKTPIRRQVAGLTSTRAGVGVAVDEDYIENFGVTFTEEKVGERLEVVARFKVTEHRGEEVHRRLTQEGARRVEYGYKRKASLETQALEYANTTIEQKPGAAQAVELQEKKSGVKITMLRATNAGGGELAAAHNVVEIRFARPMKDEDIFTKAEEGFRKLGIGTAQPAEATLEAYKRAKIMAYADPDSAREIRALKDRSPAAVQQVWEKSVRRNPKLAQIETDAELREVGPGQVALYSKQLSGQLEESGVKWLSHTTGKGVDVVELTLMREEDGLLSSRERYQRGLFFEGLSTGRDFETGGADNAFLRVHTSDPTHLTKGDVSYARWVYQIDPSEAGRLDAYFTNHDNFGEAADYSARKTVTEIADLARTERLGGGNELMLQKQVPRSAIRRVIAKEPGDRTDLIKRLRARGLTGINGVPLEDFVVLKQE